MTTTIDARTLGATTTALDLRMDAARVQRAALHYAGALLASGTSEPAPRRQAHQFMQDNGFPVASVATVYRDVETFGKVLAYLAEVDAQDGATSADAKGPGTSWSVFGDALETTTSTIAGVKVTTYALAKVPANVLEAWRAVYRPANSAKRTAERAAETLAEQEEQGTAPVEAKRETVGPWRALADALHDMDERVAKMVAGTDARDDQALADALEYASTIYDALAKIAPRVTAAA